LSKKEPGREFLTLFKKKVLKWRGRKVSVYSYEALRARFNRFFWYDGAADVEEEGEMMQVSGDGDGGASIVGDEDVKPEMPREM
jgi:hypothetical protein